MRIVQGRTMMLVGAVALFQCNCAFGTRHVVLDYPPQPIRKFAARPAAAAMVGAPTTRTVAIEQFADRRADKYTIGEVRNGYGMRTAVVVAENDPAEWVVDALAFELENRGFHVVKAGHDEQDAGIPRISGELLTVYCTALFGYEGKTSFIARVEHNDRELLDRRYSGDGSVGLNLGARATSFGTSLAWALSEAAGECATDVAALNWDTIAPPLRTADQGSTAAPDIRTAVAGKLTEAVPATPEDVLPIVTKDTVRSGTAPGAIGNAPASIAVQATRTAGNIELVPPAAEADVQQQSPKAREEGASGWITIPDVSLEDVHMALMKAGYGASGEWGEFGPQTAKSVQRFQKARHLPATGVIDGPTWDMLGPFHVKR